MPISPIYTNSTLMLSLLPSYTEGMKPLVLMQFGSHLYGTNTENSDLDYKGVFMPGPREMLLGTVPKSLSFTTKKGNEAKNTKEDFEIEWYSLPYFLKLALEGQTVAIDMLHAGPAHWFSASDLWVYLYQQRRAFYTKNLHAFVGYARRQAAKYGIKGSRLSTARTALDLLQQAATENRLVSDLVPRLTELNLEHVAIDESYIDVCGKKLQRGALAHQYIDSLTRFTANYGERARQAEASEGIDWKAMSHAIRAGYEVRSMLRDGDFEFPLVGAGYLKQVKAGAFSYQTVAEHLEDVMQQCEELAAASLLPEHPDRRRWEQWLVMRLASHMKENINLVGTEGDLHTVGQGK